MFTAIALMIFMVSPVLIPLIITGVHAVKNWRQKDEPVRHVIDPERHAAGSAA